MRRITASYKRIHVNFLMLHGQNTRMRECCAWELTDACESWCDVEVWSAEIWAASMYSNSCGCSHWKAQLRTHACMLCCSSFSFPPAHQKVYTIQTSSCQPRVSLARIELLDGAQQSHLPEAGDSPSSPIHNRPWSRVQTLKTPPQASCKLHVPR